ncbi:MAG: hypothetical protein VX294_04245 [Candidatus Latescibacterota bacterium]|nr:hypothetical protein [Candidatus Latescibacterota bacterium]
MFALVSKKNAIVIFILFASIIEAELGNWKLGGNGLSWSDNDTVRVLIDTNGMPGSIQPQYIHPDINVIGLLKDWSFLRQPKDLGYIDGERPRIWKWNEGNGDPTENGVALIDGDSTTYNSSKSEGVEKQFFTIDLGVPVPAQTFGFHAPSGGYRSDGTPLRTDATPAFQISLQEENSEIFGIKGGLALERVVAEPRENLVSDVRVDFPQQYSRFFRWVRKLSTIDEEALSRDTSGGGQGNQSRALLGTISEFEVYGEGVPRRAIYKTKIIELDTERNFGRLFFSSQPLEMVSGVAVNAPQANVGLGIEVRTGRDEDPNIYREYTVTGKEKVVDRNRFENELRTGFERTCASCDFVQRAPRPGMRASILYDRENWTYWSSPITQSGLPIDLASGEYIQLRITLESESYRDFMRLDSLWIETAPLLVERVVGEVALATDLSPIRGIAEVELGSDQIFSYEIQATFSSNVQSGFDSISIRTGTTPFFRELWKGDKQIEPQSVSETVDGLEIILQEKITSINNAPLRVIFSTGVFQLATTFLGQIHDSGTESLPQQIVEGDASEIVNTNSLRVISSKGNTSKILQNIMFSTSVITPNSDGINDELEISFNLFSLPAVVPVELCVFALDGTKVATIPIGLRGSGHHVVSWDGLSTQGNVLNPGIYMIAINLMSEKTEDLRLRPIGLAY